MNNSSLLNTNLQRRLPIHSIRPHDMGSRLDIILFTDVI